MKQLYPIGTQLITRRRSQKALYEEVFDERMSTFFPGNGSNGIAWRVTIAEENQKWLSPVPIAGDLGHFVVNENFDGKPFLEYGVIYENDGSFWLDKPDVCPEVIITSPLNVIEKRTYPNGQRAPLIEWDEVILPEETAA